jgi:hypothetical protein
LNYIGLGSGCVTFIVLFVLVLLVESVMLAGSVVFVVFAGTVILVVLVVFTTGAT